MTRLVIFTAISICVAVWLSSLYHLGIAHAAPVTTPDAVIDPIGFADYVEALWKSGAILNTVIVAAFGVLKVLQPRVPWLQQGYRAVLTAGAIGVLSLLADGISNGRTPTLSMIVIAVTTTAASAMHPKHPEGGAA